MEEKKYPENKRNYNKEYSKKMIKLYTILLNRNTDKDIIDYLDNVNGRQQYFKSLIRADIKKHTK